MAAVMAAAEPRVSADVVAENLDALRRRIEAAGADPAAIRVVAVTKGFGADAVRAALGAGLSDIGENYAQELLAKADAEVGIRWHFLGPVQRNKVPALASTVSYWQSVDRLAVGEAIAARHPGASVLVQVNTSGESSKHGCRPDEVEDLVTRLRQLDLDVGGLMTLGPLGAPEEARRPFSRLAGLARRLDLRELSMGMSDDVEVAVQEGATMVRIGRGLFGPRPPRARGTTVGSLNGGD